MLYGLLRWQTEAWSKIAFASKLVHGLLLCTFFSTKTSNLQTPRTHKRSSQRSRFALGEETARVWTPKVEQHTHWQTELGYSFTLACRVSVVSEAHQSHRLWHISAQRVSSPNAKWRPDGPIQSRQSPLTSMQHRAETAVIDKTSRGVPNTQPSLKSTKSETQI